MNDTLKDGPDIARIASLVGDPARANMLTALMAGSALTASELALEAGVTLPTASSHLAKLMEGGLLSVASEGRHRYYGLSGPQVASMLEAIMGVAASVGPKRVRPGPREPKMREARVCYDHLAGEHVEASQKSRRPVCRDCLDWSVRRSHLAGTLGAAILDKILTEKWARREKDSRVVTFSPRGKAAFERVFLE
jgi:DNA-binding transcriptional ArsR family regulator